MRKLVLFLVVLALAALAVAPALAQTDTTVTDVVVRSAGGRQAEFSTLLAAVQAAGLAETLASGGPFTVFAPTDAAFATLLNQLGLTADQLLANTELLTAVLTYHVVPGEFPASAVVGLDGVSVNTVNGNPIVINIRDGNVFINQTSQVVATDVEASNGIIHVIDEVLLPPYEVSEPGDLYLVVADAPVFTEPAGVFSDGSIQACQTFFLSAYDRGFVRTNIPDGLWVNFGALRDVAEDYGQPGGEPIAPECRGQ